MGKRGDLFTVALLYRYSRDIINSHVDWQGGRWCLLIKFFGKPKCKSAMKPKGG
jgi:hypothetical protein